MKLALATWYEVDDYLARSRGVILPVGSTEQHGPMGLIGTDALCAEALADAAAEIAGAMVAPTVPYAPAPFNMSFPGTVSISEATFERLVTDIARSLLAHGFDRLYVLNAHGANLAPLQRVSDKLPPGQMRIRSWWSFGPVRDLRRTLYGDWEGLHATPSEIAVTQALYRTLPPGAAAEPPRKLSPDEIAARAGDNHGTAERHRHEFPDGRVGAHSALATAADGERLLATGAAAIAQDYLAFLNAG